MILSNFVGEIIHVFIPSVCLLCGTRIGKDNFICEKCSDFESNIPFFCGKCGLGLPSGFKAGMCRRCVRAGFYFDRNLSPFLFKGTIQKFLYLFKYKGHKYLGNLLSDKITSFINAININLNDYDLITYVPLHPRKLREREYNQSFVLAYNLSEYFSIPLKNTLAVKRYIKSQTLKDSRLRQTDIMDNFHVIYHVRNKRILLIDDVFTTGATVSECSRVLKDEGAIEVLVITSAITKPDDFFSVN